MGSDNGVYYKNNNGEYEYLGELGGDIDASFFYSNLLDSSMKEYKLLDPFSIKKRVNYGGVHDLKSNMHTIYGIGNSDLYNGTRFLFDGYRMRSEDIGNHHYGVAMASNIFISKSVALRQAGKAQIRINNSRPEWQPTYDLPLIFPYIGIITIPIMLPPYGDDPIDQYWIKQGFDYYEKHRR